MSLKSGLLSDTTWALNMLTVLLYDDATVQYFGLGNLCGLLNELISCYRKWLEDIFGENAFVGFPRASRSATTEGQKVEHLAVLSKDEVDDGQPKDRSESPPLRVAPPAVKIPARVMKVREAHGYVTVRPKPVSIPRNLPVVTLQRDRRQGLLLDESVLQPQLPRFHKCPSLGHGGRTRPCRHLKSLANRHMMPYDDSSPTSSLVFNSTTGGCALASNNDKDDEVMPESTDVADMSLKRPLNPRDEALVSSGGGHPPAKRNCIAVKSVASLLAPSELDSKSTTRQNCVLTPSPKKLISSASGAHHAPPSAPRTLGKLEECSSVGPDASPAACPSRSRFFYCATKHQEDAARRYTTAMRRSDVTSRDGPELEELLSCSDEIRAKDNIPLNTLTDCQLEAIERCKCVSNVLRGLSFLSLNDRALAGNSELLWLLSRVLLLNHEHLPPYHSRKLPPENPRSTTAAGDKTALRTPDASPTKSQKSATDQPVIAVATVNLEDFTWWWEGLDALRDDAFVILCNVAASIDLQTHETPVAHSVCDGLLHWVTCPSSYAQDPLETGFQPPPPSGPPSNLSGGQHAALLSPERYSLEILTKLSVLETNIDLLLATAPYERQERFIQCLVRKFSPQTENPLREFALVLLSAFAAGSDVSAAFMALETNVIEMLLVFLEAADASMHAVVHQHGMQALRENPEMMGTSVGMLRRAANALSLIARVPDCRHRFARHQDRLLEITMSQLMDSRVAAIIAEVLFEYQKAASAATTPLVTSSSTVVAMSSSAPPPSATGVVSSIPPDDDFKKVKVEEGDVTVSAVVKTEINTSEESKKVEVKSEDVEMT